MEKDDLKFYVEQLIDVYEEILISDESIHDYLRSLADSYKDEIRRIIDNEKQE